MQPLFKILYIWWLGFFCNGWNSNGVANNSFLYSLHGVFVEDQNVFVGFTMFH